MLDYFFGRIFIWKRKGLRRARREVSDAVRNQARVRNEQVVLQQDEQSGQADKLKRDAETLIEEFIGAMEALIDVERTVELVELTGEKDLVTLEDWFARIREALEKAPGLDAQRKQLLDEFSSLENEVKELALRGYANLKQEYLNIESEAARRDVVAQNVTWNAANVMETVRQLFKLRSKYKTESRELKGLITEGHRTFVLLDHVAHEQDAGKRARLIKELEQHAHLIQKEFPKFKELLIQMQTMFNLIVKTCEQVFEQYEQSEAFVQQLLARLKESGYPEVDEQALEKEFTDKEHDVHERIGSVLRIMQRGRHDVKAAA